MHIHLRLDSAGGPAHPLTMLTWLILLLVVATPWVLAVYGRRFLGEQTHPAALFILAWMASAFLLGAAALPYLPVGVVSLVWVLICFGVVALVRKARSGKGSA